MSDNRKKECRYECPYYDWTVGTCAGECQDEKTQQDNVTPPSPFNKPQFDADAAEDYITNLCIEARKAREEVFRKDNLGRDRFDFVYSDQYNKLLGQETAYRRVLRYFAMFDF